MATGLRNCHEPLGIPMGKLENFSGMTGKKSSEFLWERNQAGKIVLCSTDSLCVISWSLVLLMAFCNHKETGLMTKSTHPERHMNETRATLLRRLRVLSCHWAFSYLHKYVCPLDLLFVTFSFIICIAKASLDLKLSLQYYFKQYKWSTKEKREIDLRYPLKKYFGTLGIYYHSANYLFVVQLLSSVWLFETHVFTCAQVCLSIHCLLELAETLLTESCLYTNDCSH